MASVNVIDLAKPSGDWDAGHPIMGAIRSAAKFFSVGFVGEPPLHSRIDPPKEIPQLNVSAMNDPHL
jgi:hypothetical protein